MKQHFDPAAWRLVSPLLERALDLDRAGRDAAVREVRADRPDLAVLLEDLLREYESLREEDFLERPPSPPSVARPPAPVVAGTVVGPYTLDAPIGAGGMGSVWRARRSDGRFDGVVAVKLLHVAVPEGAEADRFTREGTLLARLSHPHVARLLDAGLLASGQPYLVLEYVEGMPIDRYADAHRLDVRARLDLFLQVASAVAYAHAHLIVHRDLKPQNILVDGAGQVKLLDFGIARLLDGDSLESAAITSTGYRALTPAYAAPEQVRGEPVTTAADVYALGVLLYRLLVDAHPTGAGCATPAEYVRTLVDSDPVLASAALIAPGLDAAHVAASRATSTEGLRRALAGDLDNILGRALRKAPERRYASVTAFADDVRRYLRHEPVNARPDRWTYRARKFTRRHRAAVAVAAGVAIALAGATAVTTERMFEARRQRDEAALQARRAQASNDFMRNLVSQIGSTPVTMKTVLDRGRQVLEQQYAHDPAFIARMLPLLRGPYTELGDYATAAAMDARALEIAKTVDDPELIAGPHCLQARSAVEERVFANAHAHLAEARTQIDRMRRPPTNLLVECAIAASELASAEERFDAAIDQAVQAVTWLEREENTASVRYITALNNLAYIYRDAGRFTDAVRVQRQVTDVTRQIGLARTVTMAVHLNNQGVSERRLGWWLAAERSLREAIELSRGIESSGRLPAARMQNYARVLVALGRRAEGKEWLARTLAQTDAAPRFLSAARTAFASVLAEEGDPVGARDALARAERELPGAPTPVERVAFTVVRAQVAAAEGRFDEARALVTGGLDAEGYPGRLSPFVHELLEYGARLAIQAGDHARAAQLARDAIAACERHYGTDAPSAHTGRAELTHGIALVGAGRTDEGRAALDRASVSIAAAAGPDHPWARDARARLVSLSR